MKKTFLGILAVLFLFALSPTTFAAEIQISIDGVAIASDESPEVKNNRTMVPLRVISEHLGATVEWSSPKVILTKNDMKMVLELDSSTAVKNGESIQLDVKPYAKNNRVFVPLRFITETFGGNISYSNYTVTIYTEQLVVDGVPVQAVQQEYRMTMGGVVKQINGHVNHNALYNTFVTNKGEKVEAPASYSWMYNMDVPGSYAKDAQYEFLDAEENSLVRFDVYSLVRAFPDELLKGYPHVLIHDVLNDEWYLFSEDAAQSIQQLIRTADENGYLVTISNNVV